MRVSTCWAVLVVGALGCGGATFAGSDAGSDGGSGSSSGSSSGGGSGGCPLPRPNLGTQCSQEGQTCDYGACDVPGGAAETCSGGIWVQAAVGCPVSGGASP